MLLPEYDRLDAVDLAALVRRGEVHPRELVDAAIERIEARNPAINAVVHRRFERAREEAAGPLPGGPLRGVPFLLKDLLGEMAGEPLTGGCRFLRDYRPSYDAEVVRRYRAAGLVILGRTNTPELGLVGTTEPLLHGPTRNPWDRERSVGGSSGGSAAAVAARMVPMAAGADGGGSIRIPAAACAVFGLKPTRGRTPLGPERGEDWNGLVAQHGLTRTVRDSALLLDVSHGPEAGDPYAAPAAPASYLALLDERPRPLRIAVFAGSLFGKAIDPRCAAAVHDAAALLRELGHEVEEAAPQIDREALVHAYFTIVSSNAARILARIAAETRRPLDRTQFETVTWFLRALGAHLSATELLAALEEAQRAGRRLAAFHERYDVLVTSTLATPPKRLGELGPTPAQLRILGALSSVPLRPLLRWAVGAMGPEALEPLPNTQLFNLTGQPAASVPMGWTADGLPLAVQLVGRFGEEGLLLQLAAQIEAASPWADHVPAIAADRERA
ncbi:MAG TPA: amidase [Thermoanaerobaculia bacterium]|nr:amidase [Thermoanaerobaculia bacterium]HXT51141.1 amidase [Thermoanaerobaculia bacterium]